MYDKAIKEELEKFLAEDSVKSVTIRDILGSRNSWHEPRGFDIVFTNGDRIKFSLDGTPCGCGMMLFSEFTYSLKQKLFAKVFKYIVQLQADKNNCGTFFCTLGQAHFKNEELLMALGFETVSEYKNLQHGQNYKQRLYRLIVEKNPNLTNDNDDDEDDDYYDDDDDWEDDE